VDAFMDQLIAWTATQSERIAELESLYEQKEEQIFRLQEKNVQMAKEYADLCAQKEENPEEKVQPQNEELMRQMEMLLSNAHQAAAKVQSDAQAQAMFVIEQANAAALQREQEAADRVAHMNEVIAAQAEMLERGRTAFENMRLQYEQAYRAMEEEQKQTAARMDELHALTLSAQAETE